MSWTIIMNERLTKKEVKKKYEYFLKNKEDNDGNEKENLKKYTS